MGRNHRRAVAAATLGLVTALGGCALVTPSGEPESEVSLGPVESAAPATPEPTPTATPSAPAGTAWVTAEASGLRFAVPADWTVLDLAQALEAGDPEALQDLADRMNLPVGQLQAASRTVDVAVFGSPVDGFTPNLTVQKLPVEELPTKEQIILLLRVVGAEPDGIEDVATPLGDGRLTRYSLSLGAVTAVGRQLAFEGPHGVVLATVSAADVSRADTVIDLVRASLAEV